MTSHRNGHHLQTASGEPGIGDGESYKAGCWHVDGKWQPVFALVEVALNGISTNNAEALVGLKDRIKEIGASPQLVTQVCAGVAKRIVAEKYSTIECEQFAAFATEIGADERTVGHAIWGATTLHTTPPRINWVEAARRIIFPLNSRQIIYLHRHKTRDVIQLAIV